MAYRNGFVIEYVDSAGRISCYKCVYCSSDCASCTKTGADIEGRLSRQWRSCKYFELDGRYASESMKMRAAAMRSSSKGKKKKKGSDKGREKSQSKHPHPEKRPAETKKRKPRNKPPKTDEQRLVGKVVRSPKYGVGRVIGAEGQWVTVVFGKDKRVRFNAKPSIESGNLVLQGKRP